MSPRKLIIVAVVALVLLALALWLAGSRRPAQQAGLDQPLAPVLAERLNDVSRVQVTGAGDATIATLERTDADWVVRERAGYPADTARLRTLLLALAEARRVEAKTANPDLYPRLGVEDVTDSEAGGVLLSISGDGVDVKLIVGHTRTRGTGTYVREAGESQSWQIDRNLAVERRTESWLQRELIDIDTARIERVEVQPPDGAPIVIVRSHDSAGDFRLLELPRGREPASEFVGDATAGLLSTLRIEDVARADAIEPDAAPLRRSQFLLGNGVRIDVTSWQDGARTWARFAAGLDADRADAWIAAEQARARQQWDEAEARRDAAGSDAADDATDGSDATEELAPLPSLAVSDPDADRAQRVELAQEEVAALNRRFDGWVFVLPNFKAANLNRSLDAYLRAQD